MSKQTVLLIGATGETGSHILNGLLESGNFTVIAGVRPSSASKPKVNELKSRGIEVRILDLENATVDELAESLRGIDTVISTIFPLQLHLQKPLADASKKAGVKRLIPCDWCAACTRGVRKMFDDKFAIQDYIKGVGVGYTFIDVVWWMQTTLPYVDPSKAYRPMIPESLKYSYGTGNVKCAVPDVRDIGKLVARITADERTLNRYVFCWTQEMTQNEALALAERVSGRKFGIIHVSADEAARKVKEAGGIMEAISAEYAYSLWVRGENTMENAKKPEYGGALDARELYPELRKELRSLEDYAKDFYLS